MTRRECLVRMFGATVAASVAPLIDLTDTTPAFWNQAPLKNLWRITLPDGTAFSFDAEVIAEKHLPDSIELTVRPLGPMTIVPSEGTADKITLKGNGYEDAVELLDLSTEVIRAPSFEEWQNDEKVLGLARRGSITMTVRW